MQKAKPRRTRRTSLSSASNDKGEYETRTEWHRVYAWGNLSNFAKTLQKGQLVSLVGKIKYRTVEEDVEGKSVKHTIAEIQPTARTRREPRMQCLYGGSLALWAGSAGSRKGIMCLESQTCGLGSLCTAHDFAA
jgi:single-stranded DNA-binding protein